MLKMIKNFLKFFIKPKIANPNELSFFEHLEDLRKVIIKSVISILILTIASFFCIDYIIYFLQLPIVNLIGQTYTFKLEELLVLYCKIALISGLILSVPVILYQLTRFVLPALYKKERKFYFWMLAAVIILFLCGVAFSYLFFAPITFQFLYSFIQGNPKVKLLLGFKSYIDILVFMVFACGFIFQTPIVITFLAKIGIVTDKTLSKYRSHAIVIIFIIAAVITPTTDIFMQLMLGIPMYILYEGSIFIARLIRIKKEKEEKRLEKERTDLSFNN